MIRNLVIFLALIACIGCGVSSAAEFKKESTVAIYPNAHTYVIVNKEDGGKTITQSSVFQFSNFIEATCKKSLRQSKTNYWLVKVAASDKLYIVDEDELILLDAE